MDAPTGASGMPAPGVARRRTALLDAATALVREGGFGVANVKAVTARAGMSAGLLYRYADGIDGLLAEVFRRSAGIELAAVGRAVAAAAPDGAVARIVALAEAFTARALAGRRLAWALLAEPVGPAIDAERLAYRRSYAEIVADIVRAGMLEGVFPEQDARISAAGIVGAIGEALIGPLSPVGPLSPAVQRSRADATGGDATNNDATDDDATPPEAVVEAIRRLCLRALGAPDAAPAATPAPARTERTTR